MFLSGLMSLSGLKYVLAFSYFSQEGRETLFGGARESVWVRVSSYGT